MKKRIVQATALLGILMLAFIIYQIGIDRIWANIKKITLENFLILVGLRFLYWLLRTLNWKVILDKYEKKASLYNLFLARMCGHAVSQITPTAQVGSEAARIYMANCSNKKISIASVIVDKTIEYIAAVLFVAVGVLMLFARISLPPKLKYSIIGGLIVFALLVFFLFNKQKKGLLGWIMDILTRIKIRSKFLEKHREKLKETDVYISDFYGKHKGAFLKAFLLYGLLMLLWTAEVHLNLLYIGAKDISFLDSFLVTSLGNLAFIFPFIPGSLGIYEATYIGLLALLGQHADIGFTLVLIRRLIALLMAGLGLFGMFQPQYQRKVKA